jgi:drug/metabolite transporter (DMT)-like permease
MRFLMRLRSHNSPLIALFIAVVSALFFAATFVFNSAASGEGGHWAWTASLRYLITLPLLLILMPLLGNITQVWRTIVSSPLQWLFWSNVGSVFFYSGLCYAAASGPSWLIAATFQTTIIAGMLCSPLLYSDVRAKIPLESMLAGVIVLVGVAALQLENISGELFTSNITALAAVILSAFAFPLGNRGLMLHLEKKGIELNAAQRVFGMTLVSQPTWFIIAIVAFSQSGLPTYDQFKLAGGVAFFSGVIATVLFFKATAMVRNNPHALAATEAMQATEIIFVTIAGVLWLGEPLPLGQSFFGLALVIVGIMTFSLVGSRKTTSV